MFVKSLFFDCYIIKLYLTIFESNVSQNSLGKYWLSITQI